MRSYSHLADDERDQIGVLRAAGRSMGASPGRSVGRKPPSPGSCSGTLSPRADIRRFTPPEPINCAGGVKRSSNERPLCLCLWVTGSPRDGRPSRSPGTNRGCGPSAARPSTPSSIGPHTRPRPYASWQKGGVENANGRLCRWLPRHLDIDQTSDQEIQEIVLTTNLTPRKCLRFKTPFQALIAELGKDVQIRFS
jgi:hypothetical protein